MQLCEMPCQAVDLLLQAAFEWRELHNILSTRGGHVPAGVLGLAPEEHLVAAAHAHCHRDSPVARAIQRHLDHRYAQVRRRIAGIPIERLARTCFRDDLADCPDLPAFLWAIGRDPRDEMPPLLPAFAKRVQSAAFRALLSRSG